MIPKYFLLHHVIGKKRAVSKELWIMAERQAGFLPQCLPDNPKYWTECVTGGFSRGDLSGSIEFEEEEENG